MQISPLTILQLTDLHILPTSQDTMAGINTEQAFRELLKNIIRRHSDIDHILITGDLVQQPDLQCYRRIAEILEDAPCPVTCLPGNHDDLAQMQQVFNHPFLNCQRSINHQNWQIICLNSQREGSQNGHLRNQELTYLNRQLEQFSDLHTLIAVHHPPVATGSAWMDQMMIDNHPSFFSLLTHFPQVKGIICGHIHQILTANQQNIPIFGCPSTCFQFKPYCTEYTLDKQPPGYRLLSLSTEGTIATQVYRNQLDPVQV